MQNGIRGEMMACIVRFREYGDASVLKIQSLDVPPPAADEVQIDVKSIGLNRAEVMFRTHAYMQEAQFPSRLEFEAAGIVKTVGTSVASFKKGDVVSSIPPTDVSPVGHIWRIGNVPARNLVKHPRDISFEEAAASWMQYVTAWGVLIEQAKLTAGDFVIVTAASSSVVSPRSKLQKLWARQSLQPLAPEPRSKRL
jgi:NADPH:quinone reductase-like Zn-dependent oxidoreductase